MSSLDANTRVRMIDQPAREGTFTGNVEMFRDRLKLEIRFDTGGVQYVRETDIEEVDSTQSQLDLISKLRFEKNENLRRNITFYRLSGRLANLIYSLNTTNTDFYAYQYKPLLNFLDTPCRGLLIADEVGLGKTIEAGLIWTEARSRFDARRLLIVCPAMLREKWKSELRERFGINATICNAAELRSHLKDYREGK